MVDVETTRLRIIIVYRPHYPPDHPVSTTVFLRELSDYLESIVMSSDLLLISGDFNLHFDVPTDVDGIRFRDLLDSMGLSQHVKRPTHFHGHTLDLLITCKFGLHRERTREIFLSHVLCHLRRAKPTSIVKHAEFRKLRVIYK